MDRDTKRKIDERPYRKLDQGLAAYFGDWSYAALFAELIYESEYWEKKKKLDTDGYFFTTAENIETGCYLTKRQQIPIIKKLEEVGLISCKMKGWPRKKYFKVCYEAFSNFHLQVNQTKPIPESDESPSLLLQNVTADSYKMSQQIVTKCHSTINENISNDNTSNERGNGANAHESEGQERGKKGRAATFTPPTREEVGAYAMELGAVTDPDYFFDYYEARGWMSGKTPILDWKAQFRKWNSEDTKRAAQPTGQTSRRDQKTSTNGQGYEPSFDTDEFFNASLMQSYRVKETNTEQEIEPISEETARELEELKKLCEEDREDGSN